MLNHNPYPNLNANPILTLKPSLERHCVVSEYLAGFSGDILDYMLPCSLLPFREITEVMVSFKDKKLVGKDGIIHHCLSTPCVDCMIAFSPNVYLCF